ncbi:MAG: phosphoribosylformylglycinamidine synthase subunit PurS, partial [Spirochaetales bacterium]|nr:phosphoribosylformylglycinamidine synthase subunit PurS [Spirochaetales bacterium]
MNGFLIQVGLKPGIPDAYGAATEKKIRDYLDIPVRRVQTRSLYLVEAELEEEQVRAAARELFCDPVIQRYTLNRNLDGEPFDLSVIVSFRPGVTDNVGRTAELAVGELLGRDLAPEEGVFTSTQYLLSGVSPEQAQRIARELLANDLIEEASIQEYRDWLERGPRVRASRVRSAHEPEVEQIDLEVPDERLLEISRQRILALNLEEMRAIRDYFRRPEVRERRRAVGLGVNPTDVELEALAQTWSEHCHHKVFNGLIEYRDETGGRLTVDSLFKSYIRRVTEELASPWLLSVFSDNAGVIRFNDRLALVYKVETHNSPSALDPYGGAMTGIVGVNRDPFGTGLGARLIANVWGYCLGNPGMPADAVPAGLLHPRRIRDGVHRGVIEGGNQSGIPYARGWELFEDRYLGKPLVFCGTLGEMPLAIRDIPSTEKRVLPGDAVVMVGGRVGKDGIHGATFSSEELHASSPVQAVQIGDPITQKKMTDMLLEARDWLLYRTLTDNGAGGLSSSVGEMATLSGGCRIDLARVPLKYQGLNPWEILVSEAQERMTLAVPVDRLDEYLELSRRRGVESTVLGSFTEDGVFHVRYGERTVACLDLEFLHHGDPPYHLEAVFRPMSHEEPVVRIEDFGRCVEEMLRRLNICSGEEKARQYDHEVQGRSIIKPFAGLRFDVPTDAAVLAAEYGGGDSCGGESGGGGAGGPGPAEGRGHRGGNGAAPGGLSRVEGIVLSEGINPFYSDIDTYWMAASVLDLAVRRVVSAGGDPDFISALDNFCWPNVVKDSMPERSHKLAQLVRACQGLYDFCKAYGVPLISGKDSMSNDCTLTDPPISVPPTLLVSVLGRLPDLGAAVTLDLKAPGDLLYILGGTDEELGASEFYRYYGESTRAAAYIGN